MPSWAREAKPDAPSLKRTTLEVSRLSECIPAIKPALSRVLLRAKADLIDAVPQEAMIGLKGSTNFTIVSTKLIDGSVLDSRENDRKVEMSVAVIIGRS